MRAPVVAAGVLGALLASRGAGAREPEPVHFSYAAPAGCPAEGELVSQVVEQGATFRTPGPGEAARSLGVVVERTERGFSGRVSVRDADGDERVRTVAGARCESAVQALALIIAMALEDAPAPPSPADSLPDPTPRPEPDRTPQAVVTEEDSGGIAALTLWGGFRTAPTGAGVMAVARGATRLGGVAAVSTDELSNSEYQTSPTRVLASGHGTSARLGAVAAWGAPWSRTDWVGFAAEAGIRGGVVDGSVSPVTQAPGCVGFFCSMTGPSTPTTWRYLSPYVAGTILVQILPKLPVRPVVGLSVVWSGDYRGASSANFSLDAGFAWRAW